MLKYVDVRETFSEVPDEISLCINLSNCPHRCKGCHSPELWEDIGKKLDWGALNALIHIHQGITCVCFLGGENDLSSLNNLARHIKISTNLKVCVYLGCDSIPEELDWCNFDFIKVGHYDSSRGALNSSTTNQIFWKVSHGEIVNTIEDITYKFYDKSNN